MGDSCLGDATGTFQAGALKQYNTANGDVLFDLPGGWTKRLVQRKSGSSQGGWDAYVFAPDGTKLRSNNEIQRYCDSKQMAVDLSVINVKKPPGFNSHSSVGTSSSSSRRGASTSGRSQNNNVLQQQRNNVEKPPVRFSREKEAYLERQFLKIPEPRFEHLHYMSMQMGEAMGSVRDWFRQRLTAPVRTLHAFDVLDHEGVPEPPQPQQDENEEIRNTKYVIEIEKLVDF